MGSAFVEHINITVKNAEKTTAELQAIFGWKIRWEGLAGSGGYTFHVGNETSYVAVYSTVDRKSGEARPVGLLNHIAIVVDNLDAAEKRVKKLGYVTHNHSDYEPGRRFYFHNDDGIEFEVVNYDPA